MEQLQLPLLSSCSPNPPLTPSQPPTFTAPPTTKVHRSSLSHSPFYPCLPISNHDKPALFRRSCHCKAAARCGKVLTGSGAPRDWGRLPAPAAPIPSIPLLVQTLLLLSVRHHGTVCVLGPSRLHNVLRHSSRSPEKTYLSCSSASTSASAATADVHFCCHAQLTFVKHSYLGISAFLVSTANSAIWVGQETLCEEKNVSAVDV